MAKDTNWDDLKVFLHVAQAESLTAGAKVLRMDPATLSRRIARLEEGMGARLFAKSPQGYHLTERGQRLLTHVEHMELALRSAQGEVEDQDDTLSGSIRIGAPDGAANFLLPQVCAEICDENPGLDMQILAVPRVLNLSKREADMAVTVSAPKTGRLSVQKISDYTLHLAATKEYLASHPPIRHKSDLKDHRLIGYINDLIFDDELDYMGEIGESTRAPLTSNSFSVQMNWARRGAGVCIVHDFAIPTFPEVERILTDQISLTRSFYLVRHSDDRRVERLNRVAQLLTGKIRQEIKRLQAAA
ncbi:LysR family transcriptional regulator [Neptunicoccus cionae]|uniref:LysR family transcriptional regulator n=1 Tax=Neptunicoccus cionae TaxID=2035344 RepID=A0A916VN67_9RHOB|nr:LysR family transcriptional regulator [Amylibacter cionae]GGA11762.1 LysR family transcriptional regulator [Amylibacter cionae]